MCFCDISFLKVVDWYDCMGGTIVLRMENSVYEYF